MLVDLHVYTSPSGGPSVEKAISAARDAGLDGVAIVDRKASGEAAQAVVSGAFGDFPVLIGVELETTGGDVLLFTPELDPFYTREEWRELDVLGLPELSDVAELSSRHGGVLLSAHPYDRARRRSPRDRVFALPQVSGMEVWTSRSDRKANVTALEAGARASIGAFAGTASASAQPVRTPWVTLFADAPTDQASFVEAIRSGDFWPAEIGGSQRHSGGNGRGSSRGARGHSKHRNNAR